MNSAGLGAARRVGESVGVRLAIIIPTLDAADGLAERLCETLGEWVIVSDGGSEDATLEVALCGGAVLAVGAKGRGQQLARGAKRAGLDGSPPDWMLFLHADTALPEAWREVVEAHVGRSDRPAYFGWGAEGRGARLLRWGVRLREVAWDLPYGDQGLLISQADYEAVGGYAAMALFEDVDMVDRLRAAGRRPMRLPARIRTDVSAYRRDGILKRAWRNLRLLRAYRRGAAVETLVERYR